MNDYKVLSDRAEDSDDVAWLKRARRKPLHFRPLEEYLAERERKQAMPTLDSIRSRRDLGH